MGYSVLARFWGRERRGVFVGVASFGVPVFSRSSLSPSPLPPPSFLVAGLGVSSPPVRGLAAGRPTSATWSGGSVMHMLSCFFSPLSARVGRPPPLSSSLFLPSLVFFFFLSLSSLSACIEKRYLAQITVNLVDPASSHMLVYKIKPGMPQRKRFPARLQTAHYDSNDFAVLHHIWMTVENLGTIQATSLTFGE